MIARVRSRVRVMFRVRDRAKARFYVTLGLG